MAHSISGLRGGIRGGCDHLRGGPRQPDRPVETARSMDSRPPSDGPPPPARIPHAGKVHVPRVLAGQFLRTGYPTADPTGLNGRAAGSYRSWPHACK